ncbi:MAG TPA: aspartate--tRNA ligase [Bacillales bacterium]|nr:aspartate--tRNA ligase [Bacillales bacterium]
MSERTHHCGKLTEEQSGEKVRLKGWVQRRRDLGGLIFIDMRDRTGIVQVVFNPGVSKEALQIAEKVRSEFVLEVEGEVVNRDPQAANPKLATGKIEVKAEKVEIINSSKTPPFMIEDDTDAAEEVRLKYRYLDLRRPAMQKTFQLRHRVTKIIRDFLDQEAFMEIETPMLTKSTPEGARDYLVPSRTSPGEFYALPQSPQIFKQLLMISGFERYYQIVRCFRDEDLRADRQPEFTQVDIETSFVETEDFLQLMEQMLKKIVHEVKGMEITSSFPRMTYKEAMDRYGSDKPDTRFNMELVNVSEIVGKSDFKVFSGTVEKGGEVKAINVKGGAGDYSRKDIDGLGEFVSRYGAKGLAWLKVEEDGLEGPIAKFFDQKDESGLKGTLEAESGDLLLFVADDKEVVADSLGALRLKLGKERGLIDESKLNFLWVTEFPLLEYDEDQNRYAAMHHPFTMPMREDLPLLESDPGKVRAEAYDIVLNGYEIGGGSRRIHEREVQDKLFEALGFSREEAKKQFGFLLEAFEYGAPPHGGIALGYDRIVMILAGQHTLRDVIPFPKTASASDPMTEAPSSVSQAQLDELHLDIRRKND